jgi:mRNA interferase MazF
VPEPARGDVWQANLSPTTGHETRGTRPCLVISVDLFNYGPAGLVVVLPITTRDKGIPLHIAVDPPEGGLTKRSFVKCEEPRSISKDRLTKRLGELAMPTMEEVNDRLRILLGL